MNRENSRVALETKVFVKIATSGSTQTRQEKARVRLAKIAQQRHFLKVHAVLVIVYVWRDMALIRVRVVHVSLATSRQMFQMHHVVNVR